MMCPDGASNNFPFNLRNVWSSRLKTYLQEWCETHRAVPAGRQYYFRSRKLFRIPTVKTKLLPCNPMFLSYKTQTFANCYNFSKNKTWFVFQFLSWLLPETWVCKWGGWLLTCQWRGPRVCRSDLVDQSLLLNFLTILQEKVKYQ